ncbi:hypothetical protein J6590_016988 [Homalodisca vitripennis]|nr:hypothetical protein J6590_016988 [Homalodisca vitripennis]
MDGRPYRHSKLPQQSPNWRVVVDVGQRDPPGVTINSALVDIYRAIIPGAGDTQPDRLTPFSSRAINCRLDELPNPCISPTQAETVNCCSSVGSLVLTATHSPHPLYRSIQEIVRHALSIS